MKWCFINLYTYWKDVELDRKDFNNARDSK